MLKRIKILQIVDSLDIGGTERVSANIYNELTKNGVDTVLIVTRNTGPLYKDLVNHDKVILLNKNHSFSIIAFIRLVKIVNKYKPAIIHVHQTSIYWAVLIKLLKPSIILIWHDHWGNSDLLKDYDRKLIRYLSRFFDAVICVNEKIREWDIRNLKLNKDFIVYIPNFTSLVIENNSKQSIPVILCMANIREQKDHTNLLRACFILKINGLPFELRLAGSLVDESWVVKIKNQVIELGLSQQVVFLGPIDDAGKVLGSADIGVLSSESEGLPVALLEYGMAGIPVVTTDVGQCKEVLGNGKFGWVVPPKDSEALAKALSEVLTDKEKAFKKAVLFQKHVVEEYGAKKFLTSYLHILKTILKN
jgi:glycosyltransferase involved in cell wall biosynthesis